jgi:hypothetical protein
MVRRRSTVRFRNGAPAHEAFRTSRFTIKCLSRRGRVSFAVFSVFAEDGIHHIRPASDGGHDYVPVDRLCDVGGLVAHGGARPVRRHQPRLMSLLAGSLAVTKPRSAPVRRVYDWRGAFDG